MQFQFGQLSTEFQAPRKPRDTPPPTFSRSSIGEENAAFTVFVRMFIQVRNDVLPARMTDMASACQKGARERTV